MPHKSTKQKQLKSKIQYKKNQLEEIRKCQTFPKAYTKREVLRRDLKEARELMYLSSPHAQSPFVTKGDLGITSRAPSADLCGVGVHTR